MMKSEEAMDQWRYAVKRDHALFMRAYAACEEVEETPREHRRAKGDMLVVGAQAGVFRPFTIIRIDYHVATDALRRLTPFGDWELDVQLDRLTAWLVFWDVDKAAAAWLRLRAPEDALLPVIATSSKRRVAAIGPGEPRIVTSALLHFGTFAAAADANVEDVTALQAMGIGVSLDLMDDTTRGELWVFDQLPPAAEVAAMAKVAGALDAGKNDKGKDEKGKPCSTPQEASAALQRLLKAFELPIQVREALARPYNTPRNQ